MTLPTSTRVTDPYETDGVQRDFEFDFPAFYNADTGHYGIEVRRLTALDYEVIDKSLYDIFLNDEDKSGYVRFHVAPMAGDDIYIAGDTTRSQQLNLINYGRYSAQSIEKAFDLIVALIQEFVSKVDEETRQRILADQALRDFLLIKFNQFTAEVTTKIDKHIGDINGFMSSLIPMFVCIMRKEIANYAETGMMQVINDFMDNEIEPLITEKVNSYLEQTDFAGAVNQIIAPVAEYVPLPFESQKTYKVNQRVTLLNGDIVKSTVAGNTANPNTNMTGWVNLEKDQALKNSDFLSVTDYRIYPNTGADLGAKINAADADARSKGKKLYFPAGEYRANGVLPTTSWYGEGKDLTIIKNHSANGFDKFLDLKNNVKPIFFQDITFNGNVNADPTGSWSGIYDTWFTGSCAFVATNSKNVLFNRCSFRDSKLAPLRIWSGCRNIVMLDCDMSHSRGNFGDGVYIHNSQNIYGERLNISNVTRIGVVFEGNTQKCYFNDVSVNNAHHASVKLGGGEFNGGFWAENSADIYLKDCQAINVGEFAFLMTTGSLLSGVAQADFALTNCTANGANYGFLNRSKENSVATRHVLDNCKSYNTPIAFQCDARYDLDEFTYKKCFAEIDGSDGAVNIRAALAASCTSLYSTRKPSLIVDGFTIKHKSNVDIGKFADITLFDADVTFLGFASMKCNISNIKNVENNAPVYIKNRLAAANTADETTIKGTLCHLTRFRTTGEFNLIDCTVLGGSILSTGKVRINNSTVKALFSVVSDDLRVTNCDMDFSTPADFFSYSTATSTNKITAKFNNCNFNKDITANDYSLKLQMDGANKAKVLINGSEFYNLSDVATTTNTHIWIVRSPTSVIYQNVIRDSTANLQKVNASVSTSEPIGSTSIVLH